MARNLAIGTTLLERRYINPRRSPISQSLHAGLCCSVFLSPVVVGDDESRAHCTHHTELSSVLYSIWPDLFSAAVCRTEHVFAHGGCHEGSPSTPRSGSQSAARRGSHQRSPVLNARASNAYSRHTECSRSLAVPGPPALFPKGGPT
jgi:hypothetical protein